MSNYYENLIRNIRELSSISNIIYTEVLVEDDCCLGLNNIRKAALEKQAKYFI